MSELEKVPLGRLRLGVRWQAKRDTAFEAVTSPGRGVSPNLKALVAAVQTARNPQ